MSLLIRDGRIAEISPSAGTLTSQHPRAGVVDASERIVLPGFVNAHYHGESFLLRAMTGRRSFASWSALTAYRDAIAGLTGATPGPLLEGLHAVAGSVHIQYGTTCVGEFPLAYSAEHLDAARAGYALAGLRHTVVLQTWDQIEGAGDQRLQGRAALVSLGKEDDYTTYSFENHTRVSRERLIPLCAHIAEEAGEVERLRRNFKKSPLAVLKDYGALKAGTQVIHGNHLGHGDLAALKTAGATLTLCPLSAASKRTGYPLLGRLSKADIRICIGTDWGSTDMMAEIRLLRVLPTLVGGVRAFSPLELIRMATINGARALGLGALTGSLEVGKMADLILLSPEITEFHGGHGDLSAEEIAATVVDHLDRGAITDVFIDGRSVFREGEPWKGEKTRLLEAYRALQSSLLRRGAAPRRDATPKSAPLLPSTKEGFVSGFAPSADEDHPRFPDGLNMAEKNPATGDQTGAPGEQPRRVKKVFGENDY